VIPADVGINDAPPTYLAAESAAPPVQEDVAVPSGAGDDRPQRLATLSPAAIPPASLPPEMPPPAATMPSSAAFATAWSDAHDKLTAGRYAEALTARLRGTRLRRAGVLNDATDVVFGRKDDAVLDVRECGAIAFSHYFNFAAPELPSVMELLGSGRTKILSDVELRLALVRLQQAREALVLMVGAANAARHRSSVRISGPHSGRCGTRPANAGGRYAIQV
jgi:hypothetical protein